MEYDRRHHAARATGHFVFNQLIPYIGNKRKLLPLIGRAVEAMQAVGGEVLITADHGNAETMLDTAANQPHTAHTLNLVPLLYIGRKAKAANGGALQDVAPTLLKMMGLPQPAEMTGKPLLEFL